MNEISAKVTGSTSVLIKTVGGGHSLNEELIAVNWFDTCLLYTSPSPRD